MGQAKTRGTFQERVQQAQERTMAEIRARDDRRSKMNMYTSAVREHKFPEQELPEDVAVLEGGAPCVSDIKAALKEELVHISMDLPDGTPGATFHETAEHVSTGISIDPQPEITSVKVGNDSRRVGTIGHHGLGGMGGGFASGILMAALGAMSMGATQPRAEVKPPESLEDLDRVLRR